MYLGDLSPRRGSFSKDSSYGSENEFDGNLEALSGDEDESKSSLLSILLWFSRERSLK